MINYCDFINLTTKSNIYYLKIDSLTLNHLSLVMFYFLRKRNVSEKKIKRKCIIGVRQIKRHIMIPVTDRETLHRQNTSQIIVQN